MNKRKKSRKPIIPRATSEYVQAMLGLRSSNASGKHADKRNKRARTRSANKSRAMRDWN